MILWRIFSSSLFIGNMIMKSGQGAEYAYIFYQDYAEATTSTIIILKEKNC
jgi:hypothetical protein